MIVSKPKIGTLFSVGIFIAIAFSLFIVGILNVNTADNRIWWYLLIYSMGPIGLVVLIKILTGVKILKAKKERFELYLPFRFKRIKYAIHDIKAWRIEQVKTMGGMFEELIVILNNKEEVRISKQENTNFDQILTYMKKKCKKTQR